MLPVESVLQGSIKYTWVGMWKHPLHPPCFHYSQIQPSLSLMKSSSDSRNGANGREEEERQTFFHPSTLSHKFHEPTARFGVGPRPGSHLATFDPWPPSPTLLAAGRCQNPHFSCLSEGTFPWTALRGCLWWIAAGKSHTRSSRKQMNNTSFIHQRNIDTDKKTLIKLYLTQPFEGISQSCNYLICPCGAWVQGIN